MSIIDRSLALKEESVMQVLTVDLETYECILGWAKESE